MPKKIYINVYSGNSTQWCQLKNLPTSPEVPEKRPFQVSVIPLLVFPYAGGRFGGNIVFLQILLFLILPSFPFLVNTQTAPPLLYNLLLSPIIPHQPPCKYFFQAMASTQERGKKILFDLKSFFKNKDFFFLWLIPC